MKDSDTINGLEIGEFATSAPHGAGNWPDEITQYFKNFKKITFLYDVGAEELAIKHAAKLRDAFPNMEIMIAKVPLTEKNADITDYLNTCEDKATALLDVLSKEQPVPAKATQTLLCLQDIEEEAIRWHVPNIYAYRMIHSLGGVQGHGKSLHLIDIAARTSIGAVWPITGENIPIGDTLYITDEDSLDKIIKPRLRLAGADMDKIFVPNFNIEDLVLPENKDKVLMWLEKIKNPKLLILDPLIDYVTGNINASESATKIIKSLKAIAEKTGVCLIYTVHFNKNVDIDSIHRVAHSYVLTSKPRLAWLLIKQDPGDDLNPNRLLCCGKTAFKPIPNMMFTIKGDKHETPYIDDWHTVKVQTADALATGDRRRDLKAKEAEEFLLSILEDQPVFVSQILQRAKKENIARRTLYRAKENICVESNADEKGRTFWQLCKE
jgi:hypothetical protein